MREEIVVLSKQEKKPEEGQCLRSSPPVMKPLLFYVLMDASTIQEKKLKIPKKMMKTYRDKLPSFATLVLPNGDDWLVRLTVLDDKLWFTNGWHEFIVCQSISVGSLLVFKSEGDSIFNVRIFNLKSYEADYTEKTKAAGQEKQFSDSYEKDTKNSCCPSCLAFALRNNVSEGVIDQKLLCGNCIEILNSMSNIDTNEVFLTKDADNCRIRPQSTRNVGVQVNASEIDGLQLNKDGDIKQTKKRKQRNESSTLVKEMEMPSRKLSRMENDVSHMSAPERERTIQSAEKFKPSNPHCRIVMRRSFISSKCLHIPNSFSSKYLSEISQLITLEDSNGKQWPVRSIIQQKSRKLSQGWSQFVKDNHLEEGDVCVFELMEEKKVVLKVTIFRVSSHSSNETKIKSEVQRKMATASATMSTATMNVVNSANVGTSMKRKNKVNYITGLNSFGGLKAQNSVTSLGLPVCTEHHFAKVVSSLKSQSKGNGKGRGGGAASSTCNAAGEIFQIAAIMNGLVLVGVAVGFVLLRIEASLEEAAE